MLQWEDVFRALRGKSEWDCDDGLVLHDHTHIHRACWLSAAWCVPRLWNNFHARIFQHNSSLPPFKSRHDSGKDKNRTSLTSSFSLLSLSHGHLYSLTPSLSLSPCLQSDIDAAVLLQLGNAYALTQAEGWSGSSTFYSPLWEMWLLSTQCIFTIKSTYRNTSSNETICQVVQWFTSKMWGESFVWCSLVASLWSNLSAE